MKKILIATNILLLTIIFFLACNSEKPTKSELGQLPADNCGPRALPNTNRMVHDDGSIDALLAKRMSEAYSKDPFKGFISNTFLGDPKMARPDAWSIWFDIAKLKDFIQTVENSVCERNCAAPLNLGVRIYYALYDPATGRPTAPEDLRAMPMNYARRHTAFLIATFDKNGNHIDFDPMNVGPNRCEPVSFKHLLADNSKNYKIMSIAKPRNFVYYGDSTAVNHGDLMPPPDDGIGTFPTGDN